MIFPAKVDSTLMAGAGVWGTSGWVSGVGGGGGEAIPSSSAVGEGEGVVDAGAVNHRYTSDTKLNANATAKENEQLAMACVILSPVQANASASWAV
ncbi:hypothetical protein B0H12DRAFT_1143248 [Mycena haematopus]|nr:hypothetical protein B0H12DRAFT_1143248 [Mycena haematopus]